jgi:hypothetical protein
LNAAAPEQSLRKIPKQVPKFAIKALSTICACRAALVPFFPQCAFLAQFGRCAIHGSLATSLTRHSLIIDVVSSFDVRLSKRHITHTPPDKFASLIYVAPKRVKLHCPKQYIGSMRASVLL